MMMMILVIRSDDDNDGVVDGNATATFRYFSSLCFLTIGTGRPPKASEHVWFVRMFICFVISLFAEVLTFFLDVVALDVCPLVFETNFVCLCLFTSSLVCFSVTTVSIRSKKHTKLGKNNYFASFVQERRVVQEHR